MKQPLFAHRLISFFIFHFSFFTLTTTAQTADEMLFMQAMKSPKAKTKAEMVMIFGKRWLETPYRGGTLETNPNETLVCNLQELDCWTFVESMTALAQTRFSEKATYAQFQDNLQKLRYRNGRINGYGSRLHYFIEWLQQGSQNGIFKDMTQKIGGETWTNSVNFMSQNRHLYPKLKNEVAFQEIIDTEKQLNMQTFYFIPKEKVAKIESQIKEGDIIAITSNIKGLDCNHEGFAIKHNGRVHLLHASADHKKVIISPEPLTDYLQKIKKHAGIMVLRFL